MNLELAEPAVVETLGKDVQGLLTGQKTVAQTLSRSRRRVGQVANADGSGSGRRAAAPTRASTETRGVSHLASPPRRSAADVGRRQRPWVWVVPAVAVVVAFRYVATGAGDVVRVHRLGRHQPPRQLDRPRQLPADLRRPGVARRARAHARARVRVRRRRRTCSASRSRSRCNRTIKTRGVLRALFFAPVVMSSLAVSYIWQFIFSYTGPLNGVLAPSASTRWKRAWTGDPTWALWTIFVVLVWQFTGLRWCMYLAGLQGIPEELDEAVARSTARRLVPRFREITLPLLAPAITVSVTLSMIFGLRRLRPGARADGRRPGRRVGDARDADLQADVRLRPVRLRHGARRCPDRADHGRSRSPSSRSCARARAALDGARRYTWRTFCASAAHRSSRCVW